MVAHIVMWRFKETAEGATKEQNIARVKGMLEALPAIISEIRRLEVRRDEGGGGKNYDAVLLTEFENFDDLERYQNHPEHKKVSAFVALVRDGRAAVDYSL